MKLKILIGVLILMTLLTARAAQPRVSGQYVPTITQLNASSNALSGLKLSKAGDITGGPLIMGGTTTNWGLTLRNLSTASRNTIATVGEAQSGSLIYNINNGLLEYLNLGVWKGVLADQSTINSNIYWYPKKLGISSDGTNFIVDFNVHSQSNVLTGHLNFQQSTNRSGLWKHIEITFSTGPTNRHVSFPAAWEPQDAATDSMWSSNRNYFVHLLTTTADETGVRYWVSPPPASGNAYASNLVHSLSNELFSFDVQNYNDLLTYVDGSVVAATNAAAGYARDQATNKFRVAAGANITVTTNYVDGGVTVTIASTGGGSGTLTNLSIVDSNLFHAAYGLTASSQTTNHIVDFNVNFKTNDLASSIHFQQSTNRRTGTKEAVEIQFWTGNTNRHVSYNSSWVCVDGTTPATLWQSNTFYWFHAKSTSDTESGVRFWVSSQGTNQLPDADIIGMTNILAGYTRSEILTATNNVMTSVGSLYAALSGGNTFTGQENVFKMLVADVDYAGPGTNLMIRNNSTADNSIARIFFQNDDTSSEFKMASIGYIGSNFISSLFRSGFYVRSPVGPLYLSGNHNSGIPDAAVVHSNRLSVTGLTIGGEAFVGGNADSIQTNMLYVAATLDFPNTTAQSDSDMPITLAAARVGDIVTLGSPVPLSGTSYTAFASNAVVFVRCSVHSASDKNPASGAFKVEVRQFK